MDAMTLRTAPAPVHLTSHVHSTGAAASAACSRSSLQPVVVRPLRTLNNIHQTLTPHVIQLHPNNSPKLSGKEQKHFPYFTFQLFQLIYFLSV